MPKISRADGEKWAKDFLTAFAAGFKENNHGVTLKPSTAAKIPHHQARIRFALDDATWRRLRGCCEELPDELEVVAYCRGAWCVFAHDAVRLLTAHGRRAVRLTDGMLEWRSAELPVAS